MSDEQKKFSLTQAKTETHADKMIREKIGDVRDLTENGSGTAIEGVDTPERKVLAEGVVEALKTIFDPEIPLNIYDLGLIYRLIFGTGNSVRIEMTLTAPGCPVAGAIVEEVRRKVLDVSGVGEVEVELVWEPAWTKERLSEEARLELGLM
jgi:FeS assembly SUF system protein